ncbi:MAG: STAS domain-containing protein [Alphaproteobacteria bacterium]|nr:STAS domain-containing protein [Alphaproteobacteria bacterium]
MIVFSEAWKAGLFQRKHWWPNIVSGSIVGVVALPLSMAFAIASGVKPEQGIYTAIIAGFIVTMMGGSRLQIAGPTGAFIVILADITAKHGVDGLQIASVMAGAVLLLMGISRLGGVIKFIPAPVITGFTAGIGVIIWVGQWKDFFGLTAVGGEHFHQKLWHLLQVLPGFHLATTGLALLSLVVLLFSARIPGMQRVPSPLTAMVVATILQATFHFDGVATIGSTFGGIPHGLPSFNLPVVTMSRVVELVGPAFTIAMLGAIESLLSAVVADGMSGTKHNSNQELIGQGLANLVTPLFGGFAATGAIARTATNIRNGGTSPLAGVIHSVVLVMVLMILAPLASAIPLCALAAILFVVCYNMSDISHFIRMVKRAPRADVATLFVTFLLTVFTDLVVAVNIGVVLAMMLFIRRMAASVEVQELSGKELGRELAVRGVENLPSDVMVYDIEGPFFFGAAENFERTLKGTHTDPKVLIIRLRHMPFIDITGLQMLEEVIEHLQGRGVTVLLCRANGRVRLRLRRSGIMKMIGPQNYCHTFVAALARSRILTGAVAAPGGAAPYDEGPETDLDDDEQDMELLHHE